MTGRHAAGPPFPFWALMLAMVILATGLVAARALGGDGEPDDGPAGTMPSLRETVRPAGPEEGSPSPTEPTGQTPRGRLVIHGTGDVSLDPTYLPVLASQGYGWAWSGLGGLFTRDDLTVINLECPVTDLVAPVPKEFNFRCDPDALPPARRAGVEVANLGNNHGYDHGPEGVVDSVRNVRAAGIRPVGAGRDRAEAEAPALFDLRGWRVAVLGFGEVLDPLEQTAGPDEPGTAAGHSLARKLRAIRAADREADLVIVTIHWGVELDTRPRAYQVDEGHAMVEAGADVIFGHHAHRLQPLEVYRGRPIFWGLGNFVWPMLSVEGSTTAVAEVTVTPGGRFRARLLPAFIVSDGHPVLR